MRRKMRARAIPCLTEFVEGPQSTARVPLQPSILLQHATGDSSAFSIADTGCQRQVAGKGWHLRKAQEILPLQACKFTDRCRFSFGPGPPLPCLVVVALWTPGHSSRRLDDNSFSWPPKHIPKDLLTSSVTKLLIARALCNLSRPQLESSRSSCRLLYGWCDGGTC